MAKLQFPSEFKAFSEKFSALAYNQDDSKVFNDLLTFIIDLFSFDNPWKPEGHYTGCDLYKRFFKLFQEIVLLMNMKVRDDGDWYDPFGNLYESQISSSARRANTGQFFTPEKVDNLIDGLLFAGENVTGKGLNFCDPTCGSVRTLIAFHAKYPGNYCCGEDIDCSCALMTVCNFILHGVNGEVIRRDSLPPDAEHFFRAWRVRLRSDLCGVPEVTRLKWEKSQCYIVWQGRLEEHQRQKAGEPTREPFPVIVQHYLF